MEKKKVSVRRARKGRYKRSTTDPTDALQDGIFGNASSRKGQPLHLRIPVGGLVFSSGVIVAIVVALLLFRVLSTHRFQEFHEAADHLHRRLESRLRQYEVSILHAQAFLHSSHLLSSNQTRKKFETAYLESILSKYVNRLDLIDTYPGLHAIGFVSKDTVYGNLEQAREAMDRSLENRKVVTSAPVEMKANIEGGNNWGLLMFAPLFRGGASEREIAEEEAVGFVYSAFRIWDVVDSTLSMPLPRYISYFQIVYGAPEKKETQIIFDSSSSTSKRAPIEKVISDSLALEKKLHLPGRESGFLLRFYPPKVSILSPFYWIPLVTAIFGIALAWFFFRLLQVRDGFQELLENKIELRTRQLRASLTEQQDVNLRLKAVNDDLESFCYSVSHDLRTPLRGIDGFSRALEEDYGKNIANPGRRYIEFIRQSAQRAGVIIDDLLRLSQLSRTELQRTKADLGGIALDVMSSLRNQEPSRRVKFSLEGNFDCVCDPSFMKIVLENLLGNAWKFTRNVSKPEIVFRCLSDQPREWIFDVQDNGAGFSMEYASKLFGVYQRLHTDKEFQGYGVGLAIVKRIILRHGGRVWAYGEPGKGATLSFSLPKTGV